MVLKARRQELTDYFSWLEFAYANRWTDGLPVVPPVPEKVEEMIAYVGLPPDHLVGEIPPKYGLATVEKLAINAVMAGCLPEYFPVVIAAVDAMLDPEFNLNGIQTTTHHAEPMIIVHGPIVQDLDFNYGISVFGKGSRANATVGRAVKLALWNIGGSYPGDPDRSNFGHPGQWSFCIAENPEFEAPGWPRYVTDLGLPKDTNAVTVFAVEGPDGILAYGKAREMAESFARSMMSRGGTRKMIITNPEVVTMFVEERWTKRDLRDYIWQRTMRTLGEVRELRSLWVEEYARHHYPGWVDFNDDSSLVPNVREPEDLTLLVSGGTGKHTVLMRSWGDTVGPTTRKIVVPRKG